MKHIHLVANPGTRKVLANLASPVTEVLLQGKVNECGNATSLTIEQITTQRRFTLPIVASAATKSTLGEIAKSKASRNVAIRGYVVQRPGGNILKLDRVVAQEQLPIVADPETRKLFAEMASGEGDKELVLTSRIHEANGSKFLVLEGNGNGKKKHK